MYNLNQTPILISTIQDPAGIILKDSVFCKISGTTENGKTVSVKVPWTGFLGQLILSGEDLL